MKPVTGILTMHRAVLCAAAFLASALCFAADTYSAQPPADEKPKNGFHPRPSSDRLFEGRPDVLEAAVAGINNVEVICCSDQQRYTMLLINLRKEDVSIPVVEIDGKPVSGKTFHQESVYGATLESQKISQETGDVQTIVLKPHSVNVIRF